MSNPGSSLADLQNFATNTANIDELITLDISDIGSGNGTRNIDMDLLANPNKVSNSPKTPNNSNVTATPYSSSGSTFQISTSACLPPVLTTRTSCASRTPRPA